MFPHFSLPPLVLSSQPSLPIQIRGHYDISFGAKAWPDKFRLRNFLASGQLDLSNEVRFRGSLRHEPGGKFQIRVDETYAEYLKFAKVGPIDFATDLKAGRVRYLHFPYPDRIALFDQVPGIADLNSNAITDYRDVVLQFEASVCGRFGAHGSYLAGRRESHPIEQYAFFRNDNSRGWQFEARAGQLATRATPLGRHSQDGYNVFLGRRIGEFSVGLLYENKRGEKVYTGIAVQFSPSAITRFMGKYDIDYSRSPSGFTAQVPVLHASYGFVKEPPKDAQLVGEVHVVRMRTVWEQGMVRNEYEHIVNRSGITKGKGIVATVIEEPWYLETEALVSPNVALSQRWEKQRQGPAQYIQRVTYRFYRKNSA